MQKLQTTTDLGMDTLSKFLILLNNSFSCCYVVIYILIFYENIYLITSYSKGYHHIFYIRYEVFAIPRLTKSDL